MILAINFPTRLNFSKFECLNCLLCPPLDFWGKRCQTFKFAKNQLSKKKSLNPHTKDIVTHFSIYCSCFNVYVMFTIWFIIFILLWYFEKKSTHHTQMWRNICSSVSKRPPPDILLIDPSQAKITTNEDGADTQTDTDRQTEERWKQDWTDWHRSMAETRQDRQETPDRQETSGKGMLTRRQRQSMARCITCGWVCGESKLGQPNPTSLTRPRKNHGQAPNTLQSDIDTLNPVQARPVTHTTQPREHDKAWSLTQSKRASPIPLVSRPLSLWPKTKKTQRDPREELRCDKWMKNVMLSLTFSKDNNRKDRQILIPFGGGERSGWGWEGVGWGGEVEGLGGEGEGGGSRGDVLTQRASFWIRTSEFGLGTCFFFVASKKNLVLIILQFLIIYFISFPCIGISFHCFPCFEFCMFFFRFMFPIPFYLDRYPPPG